MTTAPARRRAAPDAGRTPEPPLRLSREVQGNVLAAFNKDFMALRHLRFPADRGKARGWLSAILNTVAVTVDVEDFNTGFSRARRARGRDPRTSATWVGVSLTARGLKRVAADEEQLERDLRDFPAFAAGAHASAGILCDEGASHPDHWLYGSPGNPVDAVLVVAADTQAGLDEKLLDIGAADLAHRMTLVHQDDGRTLPGALSGHEHFGFKDGLSQPGVRDFHPEDPDNPGYRDNHPGSDLVAPGEFVFGHPAEDGRPRPAPAWMDDGSFQVVRRLAQDVAGWRAALEEQAAAFEPAITAERLGACLVGRHLDGTPLASAVNPVLGLGSDRNDFDYADDARGLDTPCAAHIRRANPRKAPPGFDANRHRVMRRGIPYGEPYDAAPSGDQERGLVFVCYNTSIEDQFEYIQAAWCNEPGFTPGEEGAPNGTDRGTGPEGTAEIALRDGTRGRLAMKCYVTTRGAVYAFTPSVTTLRRLARGERLPR